MRKPQIVVANKIDIPEARTNAKLLAKKLPGKFKPLHLISAATGEGVKLLVQEIGALLDETAVSENESHDAAGA
jgi:GTP-binding protein